jgi:hypothetical protein
LPTKDELLESRSRGASAGPGWLDVQERASSAELITDLSRTAPHAADCAVRGRFSIESGRIYRLIFNALKMLL